MHLVDLPICLGLISGKVFERKAAKPVVTRRPGAEVSSNIAGQKFTGGEYPWQRRFSGS
jgi:hypothetical protein